jgi:hypothetical protein
MQTLSLKNTSLKTTSLTFLDDAHALVAGFFRALTEIAMAPIERIARASDVGGVLPERRTRRSKISLGWPFSFRNLNHLS